MELRERAADVWVVARDREISVIAAGLAYYAFNALLPLLVLVVVALSVGGYVATAAETLVAVTGVNPADLRAVTSSIQQTAGILRVAGLAVVLLAYNGFRMGDSIEKVFTSIYGGRDAGLLERAGDVLLVFVTWMVSFALVVLVGVVLSYVGPFGGIGAVWPVVLFVGFLVAFLPLYLVFPDDVSLTAAFPGATLAAIAWALSSVLLRAYASMSASVHFYGVVGLLLLVLTWLYLGGLVLLLGAVVNAVLAGDVADNPRR